MEASRRLIDMTLDELLAVLDARDAERRRAEAEQASVPSLVYGLAGIQQLLAARARRIEYCTADA